MTVQINYLDQVSEAMIDKTIGKYGYTIVEEIGRGSFGIVFLAQILETNEYVAIKVLCKKGLDESKLELQQQEIDIQKSLEHPSLLGLVKVIQEPDFAFMIMDVCEGGDLFDNPAVKDHHAIFLQILKAIEYMHENNVYHRDIKLENILLSERGDSIKVADFGLATRERYRSDFECGSTRYLGPEHFSSIKDDDDDDYYDAAASDIWALGILLLALLFRRNPWEEATAKDYAFADFKKDPKSTLMTLYPHLDLDHFRFLQKVLAIDPTKRVSIGKMRTLFTDLMNNQQQQKLNRRESYDSAIFSQEEDGGSWSDDLVEKDILDVINDDFESIALDSTKEDQEQFIHDQEKEYWWL